MRKVCFMRKKHMKPVALGLAAVMTIMSVGNVTYAVNPADTLQDQGSTPPLTKTTVTANTSNTGSPADTEELSISSEQTATDAQSFFNTGSTTPVPKESAIPADGPEDTTNPDDESSDSVLTTTDIPDTALYARILNTCDNNGDGMIQKSEAESIITLELNSNFQVKDFTGIEYLKNLQNLWIYYLFDGEADEKSTVLT